MMQRISKCPCGHPTCQDWHVPGAQVQGVKFTEEEAKAITYLLSNPLTVAAGADRYDWRLALETAATSDGGRDQ